MTSLVSLAAFIWIETAVILKKAYDVIEAKDCFSVIERFSFECRKVVGFALATLKKFAPIFHPIRSKTKSNRDSLARVFPRFASATCNYF